MKEILISKIKGIKVGHAQNFLAATGCTVILSEEGAIAGVDVRGGSPGTRETDLLDPVNLVEHVHAVLLSGGSAFGLDAASGIMEYLEKRNVGFDVNVAKVPIVTGAVLFDLPIGDAKIRPDKEMGYQACMNSNEIECTEGTIGAGTGATVGKFQGPAHAMKGGIGVYCVQTGDLKVGAIIAVNCLGDVIDPADGSILAGCLNPDKKSFANTEDQMIQKLANRNNVNLFSGNTTIGAVCTNARLTKSQANKIASMAHDGYARTMKPAHSMVDGDTIFALGTGEVEADINVIGLLAARTVGEAVIRGIKKATSLHGHLAASELRVLGCYK